MEHAESLPAEEPTLNEERIGWILDQLSRLPEGERDLLRLRYFEGRTVSEVGDELGISQAGASKRLEKALTMLRDRAQRQGWLCALLPSSWAAGLAGTSPMKLSIAGATALTATVGASFFLVDPDTPVQGNTASMKNTTFVASSNAEFDPHENKLWCASLKLACEAFVEATRPKRNPAAQNELLAAILMDPFHSSMLDPQSYVAVAGLEADELIETAQAELDAKFGHGRDPILDQFQDSDLPLAYAFLAKAMHFETEFEDNFEMPFSFGESDVESWGLPNFDPMIEHQMRQAKQIRMLHYANRDDFVMELVPEGKDRIVLARLKPGRTLAETWKAVQRHRTAFPGLEPAARKELEWREGDRFLMPKLDFDLNHVFSPLEFGVEGVGLATALQTLRVRLDHRGAEIKSRTMILRGSATRNPKECIFDGPFLAAFVEKDADWPYALMWIGDPEILVPRKVE